MKWLLCLALGVGTAAACSSSDNGDSAPLADAGASSDAGAADAETYPAVFISAEPQRTGDATKGYHSLVNEPYVPCGVPDSAYTRVYGQTAAAADLIPGRDGRNRDAPL